MTVQISGSSGYIADFSNATVASRQAFQTSTANSTTGIYALPSGTSTAASWQATNAADPTNASKILIATNGSTDVQLVSGRNGTGTYLPLSFYTNGSQQAQLDTSGNLTVNGSITVQGLTVGKGAGTISTNTAVGTSALAINSSGSSNTAGGYQALKSVTVNSDNTAFGTNAARDVTGSANSAFGSAALIQTSSGNYNTAIGQASLFSNLTNSNNTAVGYQAGYYATGGGNTYIGVSSGANNTNPSSGTNNTTLGYQAGRNISSGSNNVAIGMNTGYSIGTGSNNVYIGVCDVSVQNVTHEIVMATAGPSGKGANTAFISPNGGAAYQGNNSATWSITSDGRIKENVITLENGLQTIMALRPVEFDYIETKKHDVSFIAQEFKEVLPDQVVKHAANAFERELVGEDEIYGLNTNLVPYLVKAIQELKAEFDAYKAAHP